MDILGIIPARYASTRFPGKPLVEIKGKTMIRRVYEQASQADSLSQIVVATDDERIAEEVRNFGGQYVLTASDHQSGTDRCAEVAGLLPEFGAIINIQGDEPYIDPRQIDLLASCFKQPATQLATLVKKISGEHELFNPNIPKVVTSVTGEAIYFSRHPIPYLRNTATEHWLEKHQYYKHIGIYGYRRDTLLEITKLPPSSLELAESLEQLRWLENNYHIVTKVTDIETIAIDTPEDLERLNNSL